MPPNQDNPFFFEANLDVSNLSKALTKAEKHYIQMSKGLSKMAEGLEDVDSAKAQAIKKQRQRLVDMAKESRADAARYQVMKKSWREERKIFKAREKLQKKQEKLQRRIEKGGLLRRGAGAVFSKVGGAIAGAVGVGLIGKAVSDFLAFDQQVRSLNTTLSGTPRLMNVAAGAVQGLTGYLNLSREELVEMSKGLAGVALRIDKLPGSTKIFRGIMMDTIHLAKSMDVSTSSVADLYDTFLRVYNLPHHELRGIASSMKFIQEKTGITGEELMSFGKNLRNVLANMTGATGKAKSQATKDLLAMAGVFKKAGVDANQMTDIFAKAMNRGSEEGQKFLQFISEGTGKSIDQVRGMLKQGKFIDVAGMLSERLRKAGPKTLQEYQDYYSQLTGLGIADMLALSKLTKNHFKDFAKQADAASKKQALHRKRAQALQHSLLMAWNSLKRAFEKLWLSIGKRLTEFIARVSGPVIKAVTDWVNWITSPKGGKEITAWFNRIVGWAKVVWSWIAEKLVPAIQWVGEKVKGAIKWWQGLSSETKTLVAVGGGLLLLFMKLGPLVSGLGGKVAGVAAGLTAIYVGAKKLANWVDEEQTKRIKATSKAKATSHAIVTAMKAREGGRVGFIKGEMFGKEASAGKTLITPGGKVNVSELQRRATELIPTPMGWDLMPDALKRKMVLEPRAALVKSWQVALEGVLGKTDMKKVRASRARDLAMIGKAPAVAAQKAPTPTPVTPTVAAKVPAAMPPTPTPTPPPPPVIEVKADSKTRNSLLAEIREILKGIQQQNTVRRASPGTAAVKGVL